MEQSVSGLVTPAQTKLKQMLKTDLSMVTQLLLRDGACKTQEEAEESVKALLQWMAAHATKKKASMIVMLHGPVDQAWHAFLLNTKAYHDFCKDMVGFFIHHTPLDVTKADELAVLGGIKSTVDTLNNFFGDQLHPLLQVWSDQLKGGQLTISAVSCFNNGYDD